MHGFSNLAVTAVEILGGLLRWERSSGVKPWLCCSAGRRW